MIVAVLGGGNGGFATAADLALAGHRVRFWARSEATLAPVREGGIITLEAEGRRGAARLDRATTDLGEALSGAEIAIVPLPYWIGIGVLTVVVDFILWRSTFEQARVLKPLGILFQD